MSNEILYPKVLPILVTENLPLESGFLPTEVVALKHIWRLIKRRLLYHTSQIFSDLFNEHISLLERFRKEGSEKFSLKSLHQHPLQLMNIYSQLIESDLSDVIFINALLSEVSQYHRKHGVTYEEIKLHTEYINEYLIIFFEKLKSPTMINGLNRLSDLINEHHCEKNKNEEIISNLESDNL